MWLSLSPPQPPHPPLEPAPSSSSSFSSSSSSSSPGVAASFAQLGGSAVSLVGMIRSLVTALKVVLGGGVGFTFLFFGFPLCEGVCVCFQCIRVLCVNRVHFSTRAAQLYTLTHTCMVYTHMHPNTPIDPPPSLIPSPPPHRQQYTQA